MERPDFQGYVRSTDPRTQPPVTTSAIRDLQLNYSGGVGNTAQQSSAPDLSSSVLDILKKYQSIGAQTASSAQQEQIKRGFETPQSLIGADPSLQRSVRSAGMGALEPTIGGARDLVAEARKAISEYENSKQEQRQRLKETLSLAAEAGSGALEGLLKTSPNIFKEAGLDAPSFIAGIRAQEQAKTKQQDFENRIKTQTQQRLSSSGSKPGGLSALVGAIRENPALLKSLTPTVKGQVISELSKEGFDTTQLSLPELGSGQRESIDQYDTLIREANNALNEIKQTSTGPLASRTRQFGALFGYAPEFTEYRSVIDNMGSILLKLRSGAAVTPQEFTRISGFIPQITDDEKTVDVKIKRFIEETTKAQENYIKRATQSSQEIRSSIPQQSGVIRVQGPKGIFEIPQDKLNLYQQNGYKPI